MWVQPKFWQPIFLLKPIRATAYRFYNKNLKRPKGGGRGSLVLVQENKLQLQFLQKKIAAADFFYSRKEAAR